MLPEEVPTIKLNPNHFADVDGDGYFETIDPATKNLAEDVLSFSSTYGCSCKQILAIKPGKDEGEMKHGCTKGTMEVFINKHGRAKKFFE